MTEKMESYSPNPNQVYLENALSNFSHYLHELKQYEFSLSQTNLNNFLLKQIQEAQTDYLEQKDAIVAKYEKELTEINDKKAKEGDSNNLLATEEDFVKKSFERQLRTIEKSLKNFVESCKNKMN